MGSGPIPGKFSPRNDDQPRLVPPGLEGRGKAEGQAIAGAHALSAFRSEDAPPVEKPAAKAPAPPKPLHPATKRQLILWTVLAAIGLAITAGVVALGPLTNAPPPAERAATVRPGQVTLETLPVGAEVLVDGQPRGLTPLTLPLDPGRHEVVIRRGTDERRIPLNITAGAQITQRVEFAAVVPGPSTKLTVVTEPSGARVSIDGESRGVSPVTIADLTAGRHRISVTSASGSAERTVTTEAGTTTSAFFSLQKAPLLEAGWLTITSPFEVKVMERDEVIGTSASSKIMIPAGAHELDLINQGLGYSNRRRIEIESGKIAVIRVDARAPLNANARPWAEVTIDGSPVGVTPIANHVLSLGSHEVLFRHPQLGERRQQIVITQQGPNRIAVDMTAK